MEEGFVVIVWEEEVILVKAKAEFQALARAVMECHGSPLESVGFGFRN